MCITAGFEPITSCIVCGISCHWATSVHTLVMWNVQTRLIYIVFAHGDWYLFANGRGAYCVIRVSIEYLLVPGLYCDGLSLYMYVLLHTSIYRDIPVHTRMSWYIPVCTGTYPKKQKCCRCIHPDSNQRPPAYQTAGLTATLLAHRVDIGFVETRYIYIVIANGAVWYLLADVGRPAPVPPRRPLRHGPSH